MKKTLVMTIVLALLLSVVSVVSAATGTVSATATKVAADAETKTTTVTVTVDPAVKIAEFELKYNPAELTYDSSDVTGAGTKVTDDGNGTVKVSYVSFEEGVSRSTFNFTFNVLANKDVEVNVSDIYMATDDGVGDVLTTNEAAKATVTVTPATVVDPTPTPDDGKTDPTPTPDDGKDDPTPTPDNGGNKPTPTPENGDKKGETSTDEEKPGKYSQTGANVLAIALPVVALVTLAGVVIAKKED